MSLSRYACFLAVAMILQVSCNGSGSTYTAPTAAVQSSIAGPASLPAGVDPDLWSELVSRFDEEVQAAGTARRASATAQGKYSAVADLWMYPNGANAELRWTYRNQGDLDLNGETNIADLTPIGVNFGEVSGTVNWKLHQVADADGNGEVNIGDVTPLGQNYGAVVKGYALQSRASASDPWVTFDWVAFQQGLPATGEYPGYKRLVTNPDPASTYRVLPTANVAEPYQTGQASNALTYSLAETHFWSMQAGGPQHTGLGNRLGPTTGDVAWTIELQGIAFPFTSVVADVYGTTYVGTLTGPISETDLGAGHLHAIDRHGQKKWSLNVGAAMLLQPALMVDGTILIQCLDGRVSALTPDGKFLWTQPLIGQIDLFNPTSIVVGDQRDIYAIDTSPRLYRLDADGSIAWSQLLDFNPTDAVSIVGSAVAVPLSNGELRFYQRIDGAPSGNVPFGDLDYAACVDLGKYNVICDTSAEVVQGLPLGIDPPWSYISPEPIGTGAVVLPAGGYAYGSNLQPGPASVITGLSATGSFQWIRPLPAGLASPLAVDPAGYIYAAAYGQASEESGMYCIDTAQNVAWFHPTGVEVYPGGPCLAYTNLLTFVISGFEVELSTCTLVAIGED